MKWISTLNKSEFDRLLGQSDAVIAHAGMGTIMMCIELNKPLLVIPREKGFGEHVNDHQVATAKKFESRGQILVAYDILDLPERIRQLHTFRPLNVQSDKVGIIHYLEQYIVSLELR